MYVQRHEVLLTTDGSGAATGYTPVVTGSISTIQYVPDGTAPYDNTVDFTITAEVTGQAVLSKSNVAAAFTAAPRQPTHDTAGAAALYAAGGTAVNDSICVANDRIKIVLAQGGASKTGRFFVTLN
jgi:hypothetical protein